MRNDDEMEEMIRLTERIDVILNQKQLREDPKLEQSKVGELIDQSCETVDRFVADFIYQVLQDRPTPEEADSRVAGYVEAVRQTGGNESAGYLEKALKEKLKKESGKSAARRRFEKYVWLVVLLLFVVGLIGVKFYYKCDVSHPLLSRPGMENLIRLGQKIKYHDSVVSSKVHHRKEGLMKTILLWPLSVSDRESGYYTQYIVLLSRLGYELKQGGHACEIGSWAKPQDQDYIEEEIARLLELAEVVNEKAAKKLRDLPSDIEPQDMVSLIAEILVESFPCPGTE